LRSFTSDRLRAADLFILMGAGMAAAAATTLLDFSWRLPGHAILRTVLPLSVGLALVPRRGSGLAMSAAAGGGAFALQTMGMGAAGVGALTSLLLTGPLLDLACRWSRRGWQIYLSFAAAALVSNMLAFAVRGAAKAATGGGGGGGGLGGGRALAEWQPQAVVTYAVCGVAAGLISAAICFRCTAGSPRDDDATPDPYRD
jgi:hypothetical protein